MRKHRWEFQMLDHSVEATEIQRNKENILFFFGKNRLHLLQFRSLSQLLWIRAVRAPRSSISTAGGLRYGWASRISKTVWGTALRSDGYLPALPKVRFRVQPTPPILVLQEDLVTFSSGLKRQTIIWWLFILE